MICVLCQIKSIYSSFCHSILSFNSTDFRKVAFTMNWHRGLFLPCLFFRDVFDSMTFSDTKLLSRAAIIQRHIYMWCTNGDGWRAAQWKQCQQHEFVFYRINYSNGKMTFGWNESKQAKQIMNAINPDKNDLATFDRTKKKKDEMWAICKWSIVPSRMVCMAPRSILINQIEKNLFKVARKKNY